MKYLAIILLLAACQPRTDSGNEPLKPRGVPVYIWQDVNGCEYLIYDGYKKGGITPRLDTNGKQSCGKEVL